MSEPSKTAPSGSNTPPLHSITPTTAKPKRTPEEQQILDLIAKLRGAEFVEQHADLILRQARSIGEL